MSAEFTYLRERARKCLTVRFVVSFFASIFVLAGSLEYVFGGSPNVYGEAAFLASILWIYYWGYLRPLFDGVFFHD